MRIVLESSCKLKKKLEETWFHDICVWTYDLLILDASERTLQSVQTLLSLTFDVACMYIVVAVVHMCCPYAPHTN